MIVGAYYNVRITTSLLTDNLLQPRLPTNFAARNIFVSACSWLEQSSVTRCFTISLSITSITYPSFRIVITFFLKWWRHAVHLASQFNENWRIFFELLRCWLVLSTSSYSYLFSSSRKTLLSLQASIEQADAAYPLSRLVMPIQCHAWVYITY